VRLFVGTTWKLAMAFVGLVMSDDEQCLMSWEICSYIMQEKMG
jgi:hypothetical protein